MEPNSETFTATLTDSPSDGVILRPDEATVTIIDDTRKLLLVEDYTTLDRYYAYNWVDYNFNHHFSSDIWI